MDNQRLIFFIIFSFSILLLWDSWQKEQHSPKTPEQKPSQSVSAEASVPTPQPTVAIHSDPVVLEAGASAEAQKSGTRIKVETDVIQAEIDTLGGDIRSLSLLKHREVEDKSKPFVLYEDNAQRTYIAQSGLIGEGLPNHKTLYTSQASAYKISDNEDHIQVKLNWNGSSGITVEKTFTFYKGSYLVDISHEISNNSTNGFSSHAYYQWQRDNKALPGNSAFMMGTYTGPAVYTGKDKFQKVDFSDIEKGKEKYPKQSNDGWMAMLQHYFFSAWLPVGDGQREFYTRKIGELFTTGVIIPVATVEPGAKAVAKMKLYAGPQEQDHISKLAPGLDLVVDYGMLTVIAAPLFWIVQMIYKLVQNWGVAIILLTILIKLAFYPLSAKSYRSMAAMRVVSPKLQKLKEQYGSDRQRLHQAMMELYKTEKINPLGGCLPVIVQMPVFIALYWVLLYSVEMRQAPFAAWIQDLSAPDPYYVLPIIMGITMIVQTKLNPTPPDPIQAKVMMMMPIVFSIFFFFFPAGLVLYWVVNNVISIAQQWQITRGIEQARAAKGHG
jgi:YidC/Oxa1 family membrane protein insertase